MKKLFILLATLVLLTTGVMAAGSQSVDPVLNLSEGAYTINGEEVAEKELKQLKATDKASSIADGDKEDEVNAIIREQNGKSTVIQKLKDLLKNVDLENYYVAGKGFYNLAVVWKSDGTDTHDGVKYKVKLQQITDQTEAVGLIHYSYKTGFEFVQADKFSTSSGEAEFTLKDTSPVMFIVRYKNGGTAGGYTPAYTGVDGMPVNNVVKFGALTVLAICAVAATAIVLKKRYEH